MTTEIAFSTQTTSFSGRKAITTTGVRVVKGLGEAQLQPITGQGKGCDHLLIGIPGNEADAAALCAAIMAAASGIAQQREQRQALSALRFGLAQYPRETLLVTSVIVGACFEQATSEGLSLVATLNETHHTDTHSLWRFLTALPREGVKRLSEGLNELAAQAGNTALIAP